MGGCMSKLCISIMVLLLPLILLAGEDTSMKWVVSELADYVEFLEDLLDQEIVHMQADIITTDGISFTRTLHQGWTYGIMAFSDERIEDLDIILYIDDDGEWIEIERDDEEDNYPSVIIEPSETEVYLIDLDPYTFSEDYEAAHYGMVIYHELPE